MARDPYIDAKGEVELNIRNVNGLLESYNRIQSTSPGSTSLAETREELHSTLRLLEADLQDLEECVLVVEGHGDRWGLDPLQVAERRGFLNRVTTEVQKRIREDTRSSGLSAGERYRDDADNDETERWEREEQQVYMRQQDDTLGVISGTLNTLASQAGLIGQEVHEHSELLDDLSLRVDTTQSRLSRVTRRLTDFIRKNEIRGVSRSSSSS